MKTTIFTVLLAALAISNASAQSCDCEILSGVLSTRTLDNDHCWELADDACVTIPDNVVVTIEEGTMIYPGVNSGMTVEKGGQIIINGTSNNPVRFIPKDPVNRTPGYWKGLGIAGEAINNVTGGTLLLDRDCPIEGGGNNNSDNSGTITYAQFHYAEFGLTLVSVGSGTTLNHIQVTNSANDNFAFYGGKVNASHLVSLDADRNDFFASNGYTGNLQFLVGLRRSAAAPGANAYGFYSENDASGTANTPVTRPVATSNTFFGPAYCNGGSLSSNFKNGIYTTRNSAATFYNTVVTSYKEPGLYITSGSIPNTDDILHFSFNALTANGIQPYDSDTWTGGCDATMQDWIDPGFSPAACAEAGNQLTTISLGHNSSSVCSSITNPVFTVSSSGLDAPDYTAADLNPPFFDDGFTYRGAFDNVTDWTDTWTLWDMETEFCDQQAKMGRTDGSINLRLTPNPAQSATEASFNLDRAGMIDIFVADAITGKAMISLPSRQLQAGRHSVNIDIHALKSGQYIVNVKSSNGMLSQHLMID